MQVTKLSIIKLSLKQYREEKEFTKINFLTSIMNHVYLWQIFQNLFNAFNKDQSTIQLQSRICV